MFARDFRGWARERLTGHWGAAVGVAFVGSLLGGGVDALSGAIEVGYEGEIGFVDAIPREVWAMMVTVTLVTALLALVIGGAIRLGICTFNLNLFHRREARFMDLFSNFDRLGRGFCMQFVTGFFVLLWSLLFVLRLIDVGRDGTAGLCETKYQHRASACIAAWCSAFFQRHGHSRCGSCQSPWRHRVQQYGAYRVVCQTLSIQQQQYTALLGI